MLPGEAEPAVVDGRFRSELSVSRAGDERHFHQDAPDARRAAARRFREDRAPTCSTAPMFATSLPRSVSRISG